MLKLKHAIHIQGVIKFEGEIWTSRRKMASKHFFPIWPGFWKWISVSKSSGKNIAYMILLRGFTTWTLTIQRIMWFQHDGELAHSSKQVSYFLNIRFPVLLTPASSSLTILIPSSTLRQIIRRNLVVIIVVPSDDIRTSEALNRKTVLDFHWC